MAKGMNWKESEAERKRQKQTREAKQKELKPFHVKHFTFYPCSFSASKEQGYVWYLFIRNWKGIFQLEVNSPRFKTQEECKAFVENNISFPFVVA